MPSVLSLTSSSKDTLRNALGSRAPGTDSSDTDTPTNTRPSLARQRIDTARKNTKKTTKNNSISHISFFHRDLRPRHTNPVDNPSQVADISFSQRMTVENTHHHRRTPVRVDHDGPWSVSVAETPHDAQAYSLYIKTPTHNLTLTRTAHEIVEFDRRLRNAHLDVPIPTFPVGVQSLPQPPPKRKSNFLNTLSRLASPTSVKTSRNASSSRLLTNSTSHHPTPLNSPSGEIGDPFVSSALDATPVRPSANSTALAAYLTTISNSPGLHETRVWKRFVRVGTDDLQSVRVERAIKKVRSDLAAHLGAQVNGIDDGGNAKAQSSLAPSENGTLEEAVSGDDAHETRNNTGSIKEDDPKASASDVNLTSAVDATEGEVNEGNNAPHPEGSVIDPVEREPSTPVASVAPASRITRSHSADFESSRMSRAFASSTSSPNGVSCQTGDESSASTTGGRRITSGRKKRSKSMAPKEPRKSQRKVVIDDFEMMRVLGKGCAGKVLLVRHKATTELYALKAITKRHVLAHQELQHTLTEQSVLKRMAAQSTDPFVVKLWWSFHDKENLFLVMDFHPGGDLATQLARWGRLGRDRARFYAAEIVEGCEGLHAAGVIYRDLKPENILIGADGHIVLTDFGLSKEFSRNNLQTAPSTPAGNRGGEYYSSVPGTPQPTVPSWMVVDGIGEMVLGWPGQITGHRDSTSTFCGTAEYLAPEVIQGQPYSYEVDWWSFGTMLYEMLTGITPFWANNHSDMYVRVLQDELQFPEDRAMDQDTKSLIRGLLQRNPALRICEPRIKKHPYFSMIDWSHVYYKRYIPPYIPPIDPSNASDTQNFDDTFLDMEPVLDDFNDDQMDTDQEPEQTDTDRTDGEESSTTPSQSRSSSIRPSPQQAILDDSVDVFDGYSFKGRHSVLLDDEDDEEDGSEGENGAEDENEEVLEALKKLDSTPAVVEPVPEDVIPEDAIPEVPEPKTPEARPVVLPANELEPEKVPAVPPKEAIVPVLAAEPTIGAPRISKDLPQPTPTEAVPPATPDKDLTKPKVTQPAKGPVPRATASRTTRSRREKSGVPALDRYLSDGADGATEREDDDEDDDWDFVEAGDGEDRNGATGPSLFARGVVDRYRLAVFRKASTPSQRSVPRSVSGMSKNSEATVSEFTDSPSPVQKRGRTRGLPFGKHHRQFLQPKSTPPSSFSSKSSARKSFASNSNTTSATSSMGGLASTSHGSHSLKSKESAMSVSGQSQSSDQSGNGDSGVADGLGGSKTVKNSLPVEELEKPKTKKLKKYKENAEKVFSLFSSPRQQL